MFFQRLKCFGLFVIGVQMECIYTKDQSIVIWGGIDCYLYVEEGKMKKKYLF